MRALSIIHYPVFGGPHNRNMRIAPVLMNRGVETFVLLPEEGKVAAKKIRDTGVPVLLMPLHRMRATPNPLTISSFFAFMAPEVIHIRKLLRKYRINVVLINGLVNPHAAFAAYLNNLPIVWQILDTRPPMVLRYILMPLVAKLADTVMCTGTGVARGHPGALELGKRLITFFPPVDTKTFQPRPDQRLAARARLGVPEDVFLIGSVGNINPQKGHEYLIRAFSILQKHHNNTFLRILGGFTSTHENYMKKLRNEIHVCQLEVDQRVKIIDPGGSVADLLPAFDIFCLTSVPYSEGIPTAILEAMACSIPVVATDVGAVSEVVENGVTGFVVPPQDPEAIAQTSLRLLCDSMLRQRMGEAGRRRAVERYDVEICADTHIRAFEDALRHHRMRKR